MGLIPKGWALKRLILKLINGFIWHMKLDLMLGIEKTNFTILRITSDSSPLQSDIRGGLGLPFQRTGSYSPRKWPAWSNTSQGIFLATLWIARPLKYWMMAQIWLKNQDKFSASSSSPAQKIANPTWPSLNQLCLTLSWEAIDWCTNWLACRLTNLWALTWRFHRFWNFKSRTINTDSTDISTLIKQSYLCECRACGRGRAGTWAASTAGVPEAAGGGWTCIALGRVSCLNLFELVLSRCVHSFSRFKATDGNFWPRCFGDPCVNLIYFLSD